MTAGEGEKWDGVGFLGVVSVTSKDAKALLIEAEGSDRKCH